MSATSSTIVNLPDQRTATLPKTTYINAEDGLLSWLLTGDHKRIAMLYLVSITFFFFIGGAFAVMIRLELLTPQGDLVSSDTYNKLFTMHGVVMVFFFLVPSIPVAGMALILGIDRFMSMFRAAVNVIGNGVATLVIARWERELDAETLQRRLEPDFSQ